MWYRILGKVPKNADEAVYKQTLLYHEHTLLGFDSLNFPTTEPCCSMQSFMGDWHLSIFQPFWIFCPELVYICRSLSLICKAQTRPKNNISNDKVCLRAKWVSECCLHGKPAYLPSPECFQNIISKDQQNTTGPWWSSRWWSCGQRACLLLWRSEFKTCRSLHFFSKICVGKE